MVEDYLKKDPSKIKEMFSQIAPRYNLMNRLMTAGLDIHWRNQLVKKAKIKHKSRILDLATGTGDIAFAIRRNHSESEIIAADFAMPMLQIGRRNPLGKSIKWCVADAMNLPFPDNHFQFVTSGFLYRNLSDLHMSMKEQVRVLDRGGRLLALDSSPPPSSLLRPLIYIYLRYGIPSLGRIFGGVNGANAYQYLPESTLNFSTPHELALLLRDVGLINIGWKSYLFGTIILIWGDKE